MSRSSAMPYHTGINAPSVPVYDNHTVPTGGMYIGTQVSIYCEHLNLYANFGPGQFGYAYPSPFDTVGGLSYVTYRVTARTVYVIGEVGPVRVIKYDNLSDGSQIALRGVTHVQGTPFGTVVPFVAQDPTGAAGEIDLTLVPKVARMFDGSNTPLRRIWPYVDYRRFVALGRPTNAVINNWLLNDEMETDNRKRERPVQADTPTGNGRIVFSDRLKNMDSHLYMTHGHAGEREFAKKVSRKFNES